MFARHPDRVLRVAVCKEDLLLFIWFGGPRGAEGPLVNQGQVFFQWEQRRDWGLVWGLLPEVVSAEGEWTWSGELNC